MNENLFKNVWKITYETIKSTLDQFKKTREQINTGIFDVSIALSKTILEIIIITIDTISRGIVFASKNLVQIFVRIIYILLMVSFLSICYLLYVGLTQKERLTESAEIASLLVSVITVISISVAIYEFYEKIKDK